MGTVKKRGAEMRKTENFELNLLDGEDFVNKDVLNDNAEKIDQKLKEHDTPEYDISLQKDVEELTSGERISTALRKLAKATKDYTTHKEATANTEQGAHGIRFYEDKLQHWNGTEWIDIENGGGSKIYLAEPTNVTITNKDEGAEITWTDPPDVTIEGVTLALWKSTVIVRKEGTAPLDEKDGTVVLESKTRDQYATEGFVDIGLTNGITYYYGIFPKTADGVCTTTKTVGITPQEIPPSQATDISVATDKTEMSATVTYTLPDDATKAKVVVKAGSEPSSSADGIVVEDSTGSATFTDIVLDTTYYVKVFTYNEKKRETASTSESFIIKSLEIVTWADGTDEQIAAMLEAHYAGDINIADYWSTGQTRTVKIASFSTGSATHVEQNVQMQIIDFDHDDLADGSGKAAVTVDMRQVFGNAGSAESEYYWGSSHYPVTDTENYSTSLLRTKLNQDFVAALPETFSTLIKTVAKKNFETHTNNSTETVTTNDKVFLLSYPEVFGTTAYSYYKGGNTVGDYEGTQYAHYATESNRKKYINNNGSDGDAKYYWLRSPSSYYSSTYGYYWCNVYSSDSAYYGNGCSAFGVAAALCL